MRTLFTEHSTLLVGGLVLILVLMRIGLQFVRPASGGSRFILWFWHPTAREIAWRRLVGPKQGEQQAADLAVIRELHPQTLKNMDSTLIALALVFFVIRPFVVQAFYIPSSSMEPTLMGNPSQQDRVLVNKYLYHLRPPKRQEIIVFRAPDAAFAPGMDDGQGRDFIKRLIGLPGDKVEVRRNRVYINDEPLDEPYLDHAQLDSSRFTLADEAGDAANFGPVRVPPGKYLVMGDNRNNSHDSRRWGVVENGRYVHQPFVDGSAILGKAMFIFWPPRAMKVLASP